MYSSSNKYLFVSVRYGRRSNWFKIHCLMQKNSPRLSSLPYPPTQPPSAGRPHPGAYSLAEQLMAFSNSSAGRRRPHKMESSRSPSPLNTSTEAVSVISSSDQSSPSPVLHVKTERAVSPPLSLFPPPPTLPDGCSSPFSLLEAAVHTQRHHHADYDNSCRRSPSIARPPVSEPPQSLLSPTAITKMPPLSINCMYDPAEAAAAQGSSSNNNNNNGRLLPHLLLDPAALYRLSPLLAMHPLLLASTASSPLFRHQMTDFRQQLDLLAERRAIFERLKAEAESRAASASPPASASGSSTQPEIPIDLSCK